MKMPAIIAGGGSINWVQPTTTGWFWIVRPSGKMPDSLASSNDNFEVKIA